MVTPRLGMTKNAAGTTLAQRVTNDAANLDLIDAETVLYLQGDIGDIPAAGVEGRIYFAEDEELWYWDDGAAWVEMGGGSGDGDVVGPAASTANNVPQWDGEDSKTLKDGLGLHTEVGSPGTDTDLVTEQGIREEFALHQPMGTLTTQNDIYMRGAAAVERLGIGEQTVVGRITGGSIAALTVAQLQTLIFGAALPENVAIILDPALSADGKYSAVAIETGTAGATLAFGQICYQAVATDRWVLAKADAAATATMRLGMCIQAAANNGNATTMMLIGKIRGDTAFPDFTKYAPVFISSATVGALSTTAPVASAGHIVRVVGWAITKDELWFQPDGLWMEYG